MTSPGMNPRAPTSDDASLLLAVARRDEAAFGALYDRMARPVFALVVRIVRSRAEAEEVLQEAFWQVWARAPDYSVELGSPFCWIVTVARRKAIDRLRANSRHLQRIADPQGARLEDDFAAPAALDALAADERRAIALAFFDGLTHVEIAAALRTPVGTVKARIRRGLLKLKPALARQHGAQNH